MPTDQDAVLRLNDLVRLEDVAWMVGCLKYAATATSSCFWCGVAFGSKAEPADDPAVHYDGCEWVKALGATSLRTAHGEASDMDLEHVAWEISHGQLSGTLRGPNDLKRSITHVLERVVRECARLASEGSAVLHHFGLEVDAMEAVRCTTPAGQMADGRTILLSGAWRRSGEAFEIAVTVKQDDIAPIRESLFLDRDAARALYLELHEQFAAEPLEPADE